MQKIHNYMVNCLILLLFGNSIAYAATTSRNGLTNTIQKIIPGASPGSGNINYVSIAQEIQYWIFALVGIIAVIYIVWVGAKLLWAPGNTEEVTTAMKSI